MKILIDGDAFPNLLKPIVIKASKRLEIAIVIVSNKKIYMGKSHLITAYIVEPGMDKADDMIVQIAQEGDLVITADIPLAKRLLQEDVFALDHRGTLYTKECIGQYLAMRNFMQELRESGIYSDGPKPFGKKDVHSFSNVLNIFLSKKERKI